MFKIILNPLAISLTINAPIQKVWDNIAQWEKQGDWMLQTRVWVTSQINEGVGTEISAFTGISRLGILDTMTVTKWEPPFTCDVIHTGKIIKGTGSFKLSEISPGLTKFDWSEEVLAPRIIFWLIQPGLYAGVRISLARFARQFR
jgi:hypothetical protein